MLVILGYFLFDDIITVIVLWGELGETSKLIGCSLHIQQPAAANLYRKCYTLPLNAAAFRLQPAVMNFDVFPHRPMLCCIVSNNINRNNCFTINRNKTFHHRSSVPVNYFLRYTLN